MYQVRVRSNCRGVSYARVLHDGTRFVIFEATLRGRLVVTAIDPTPRRLLVALRHMGGFYEEPGGGLTVSTWDSRGRNMAAGPCYLLTVNGGTVTERGVSPDQLRALPLKVWNRFLVTPDHFVYFGQYDTHLLKSVAHRFGGLAEHDDQLTVINRHDLSYRQVRYPGMEGAVPGIAADGLTVALYRNGVFTAYDWGV